MWVEWITKKTTFTSARLPPRRPRIPGRAAPPRGRRSSCSPARVEGGESCSPSRRWRDLCRSVVALNPRVLGEVGCNTHHNRHSNTHRLRNNNQAIRPCCLSSSLSNSKNNSSGRRLILRILLFLHQISPSPEIERRAPRKRARERNLAGMRDLLAHLLALVLAPQHSPSRECGSNPRRPSAHLICTWPHPLPTRSARRAPCTQSECLCS